jgi:cytochrome c oxidase subunit II
LIGAKNNARISKANRGRRRLGRFAALRVFPALAVLAGGLLLAPDAFANFITPKSGGSPNANSIHTLYVIVLIVAAIVFVVVEAALVIAVFRFRAKKHPVAHQTHGNTKLEIGWTAGAAVILLVLTVVTFIKLPSIINPPNSDATNGLKLSASVSNPSPPNGKKLDICVQARQYIWRYSYGNGCKENTFTKALPYSFTTMVVPVHTTVVLTIQSSDVIHSWWIPSLGGKVDAVPGYTVYTWFKATHTGLFHGQCAQLCGTNHAAMLAYVRVVSPQKYETWLAKQKAYITNQNNQVGQLRQILTKSNQLGN